MILRIQFIMNSAQFYQMHIFPELNLKFAFVSATEAQMTDVVTSTSGAHQEQHTDDSSQDVDVATDTRRSENDGENGESRRDLNDRNPEPPAELLEERILDAGNIGGTMFSKHWLFTTLMKLIQVRYEYIVQSIVFEVAHGQSTLYL